MIDIVERAFAAAQTDQILDRGDEILVGQNALAQIDLDPELLVDLVTADAAEIVLLRIEEEPLEQARGHSPPSADRQDGDGDRCP